MNLPLGTAFTESHRFWVVMFSFSFVSMHILIHFLISSVICWLFRSMLFNLHMFIFLIAFHVQFSSVQFSCSVVSDSLQPHESQHARPPCPSPTLGVHPNSCALSWWCHPAISSSVVPFSSCLLSFQHQGLFQWVNSSHQVAKGLEFQPQHQSFQWTPRTGLL